MRGWTSLWINRDTMVTLELDHRRAAFVLGKIDEILSWEKTKEQEKDVRFVELGEYLCEVRAKQYWRLEKLKSFDEFLEKRFADSRRKAYYLMAIHEHLTRVSKPQLREMGWTKARELAKVARKDGAEFACAPWVHKAKELPKEQFRREVERHLTGKEMEAWEILYFKFFPDFMDKYGAYMVQKVKSSGASPGVIQAQIEQLKKYKEMYQNPLINAALTFIEPFPIGLAITLISAIVLGKKPQPKAAKAPSTVS